MNEQELEEERRRVHKERQNKTLNAKIDKRAEEVSLGPDVPHRATVWLDDSTAVWDAILNCRLIIPEGYTLYRQPFIDLSRRVVGFTFEHPSLPQHWPGSEAAHLRTEERIVGDDLYIKIIEYKENHNG